MNRQTIQILGGGAVGAPLAVFLKNAGHPVILLRCREGVFRPRMSRIDVRACTGVISAEVEERPFSGEIDPQGCLVVAAKAYANESIAQQLEARAFKGPVVLLQNGLGVERPFLDAGFQRLLRGVIYLTSEQSGEREYTLRIPRKSLVGVVAGPEVLARDAAAILSSPEIIFEAEPDIQRAVWRKATVNAVFNSICTVLEEDNGLFHRNPMAMELAGGIVGECVGLARALGIRLEKDDVLDDLARISGSSSQFISTLQDVRAARPTEMEFLNHAFTRMARSLDPAIALPLTTCLGNLVQVKIAENHRGFPTLS